MPITDIIVGREPDEIEKRGSAGCVFLGKHIVGKGEDAHLTNKILMDVSSPHVVLIVGKRGSGKSYSGAVIAEEIMKQPDEIKNNLSCIMLDTMGIFWSMKNPNEKDLPLLSEWNMKPSGFPIQNFVPIGLKSLYEKSGVGFDGLFSIRPDELSAGDWISTFGINHNDSLAVLLERIIKKLRKSGSYGLNEIIDEIGKDERSEERERLSLQGKFFSAMEWGIFSSDATPIDEFMKPGTASVLDVSLQDWNVRNLMLSILARKIYEARIVARREEEIELMSGESVKKLPMTWLIMDESHEFLPAEGKTAASDALLTLVRQGRQPGISCVFITQMPDKLHKDVVAQSDLVIAHRLTAKSDIDALSAIMQTYLLFDIKKFISELPKTKGSALVLDDNSERLYNIQVRPRQSWHAGGSPSALKQEV